MNDGERGELLSLLHSMWTIRAFEEKVSEIRFTGQIAGFQRARFWRSNSSRGPKNC